MLEFILSFARGDGIGGGSGGRPWRSPRSGKGGLPCVWRNREPNRAAPRLNPRVGRPKAMQATSDEVLIGRIANGDRLAMQVLYARHHVRVFRFVIRLVRDESAAEDLISDVFLDVWREAGRFQGRSSVSTWMLAMARFKALSALRRRPDEEFDGDNTAGVEEGWRDPHTSLEKT